MRPLAVACALMLAADACAQVGDVSLAALRARLEERESALPSFVATEVVCQETVPHDPLLMLKGRDPLEQILAGPFGEGTSTTGTVYVVCVVVCSDGWARFDTGLAPAAGLSGAPGTAAELWSRGTARWDCHGPAVSIDAAVDAPVGDRWSAPSWRGVGTLVPYAPQGVELCRTQSHGVGLLEQALDTVVAPAGAWAGTGPSGEPLELPALMASFGSMGDAHSRSSVTVAAGTEPVTLGSWSSRPGLDLQGRRRVVHESDVRTLWAVDGRLYPREIIQRVSVTDPNGAPLVELGWSLHLVRVQTDHPLLDMPWPLLAYDEDRGLVRGPSADAVFASEVDDDISLALAFAPETKTGAVE